MGAAHSTEDYSDEDHAPLSGREGEKHRYKQHFLGLSLLLRSEGRQDFEELVQCVEGLKDIWPDPAEKRGSLRFMKHFYYEVRCKC